MFLIKNTIDFTLFSSNSVPKALSALAVSDSDEEDQESTPVITNGDSAPGSGAKPTAPMPESSADNGKYLCHFMFMYRADLSYRPNL